MSFLGKTTIPYTSAKLELIKIDFRMECLKAASADKDQEITFLENEMAALQARLEVLKEIRQSAQQELEELSVTHLQLSKEIGKEKEGTDTVDG